MNLLCRIRQLEGVPTVYVGGKPVLLLGYKSGAQDLETYQAFVQAGYHTGHCNVKIEDLWQGPQRLDLTSLRHSIETILTADPRSYILLELHVNAPDWWLQAHPEEQQIDASGQRYGQSMASELWLHETLEVVSACVRECERSYGEHVILYLVGAGHTWEWFHRTPLRYVMDCSAPLQRAFISWLQSAYGSERNLALAWDKDVSFATVSLPAWREVVAGDSGCLRDPVHRRPIYDFYRFYSELMADRIIRFGQIVKEACAGTKLYGVFYAHLLDWLDNPLTAQHSGHFALQRILDSGVVDVLAGPNSYMNRTVGHEASFTSPVASVQLHGKLWLAETDTRTHLANPIQDCCGRPQTLSDSLILLKRDFCHALVCGVDAVWFSLFSGWFADPEIMRLMGRMRAIANMALRTDRRSIAQVAVLLDERSILATAGRDAYRVDPFISQEPRASDALAHMGCPYDLYLLSDLEKLDLNRYRLFLFLNAIWLDDSQRASIDRLLKRDQRTLVWLGLPGAVNRDIAGTNMTHLVGMGIELSEEPAELFIRLLSDAHPIIQGLNLGNSQPTWVDGDFAGYFGTNQILSPRACVCDQKAIPLGVYSRDGRVGFALRDHDTWRSVFVGTPFVPPAILRAFAHAAGVHIYNQSDWLPPDDRAEFARAGWNPDHVTNPADDILYANDNWLALHVKYAGQRRIALPEPRQIVDAFTGELVSERTSMLEWPCSGPGTFLFYIGRKPWKELC